MLFGKSQKCSARALGDAQDHSGVDGGEHEVDVPWPPHLEDVLTNAVVPPMGRRLDAVPASHVRARGSTEVRELRVRRESVEAEVVRYPRGPFSVRSLLRVPTATRVRLDDTPPCEAPFVSRLLLHSSATGIPIVFFLEHLFSITAQAEALRTCYAGPAARRWPSSCGPPAGGRRVGRCQEAGGHTREEAPDGSPRRRACRASRGGDAFAR